LVKLLKILGAHVFICTNYLIEEKMFDREEVAFEETLT